MATPATGQKRQELMAFIERVWVPEPAVQAVVLTGEIVQMGLVLEKAKWVALQS